MGIVGTYDNWYSISHLAKIYEVKTKEHVWETHGNCGNNIRNIWQSLWDEIKRTYEGKSLEHHWENHWESYWEHFGGCKTLNPKRREKNWACCCSTHTGSSHWMPRKIYFPLTLLFRTPFCLREFDRCYLPTMETIHYLVHFFIVGNSSGKWRKTEVNHGFPLIVSFFFL